MQNNDEIKQDNNKFINTSLKSFQNYLLHIKLLIKKNFILIMRNPKGYIFLALTPMIIVFLISFW